MNKKIIAFVLALTMVFALASCSSNQMKDINLSLSQFYSEPTESIFSQPDCAVIVGNEANLFNVKDSGAAGDGSADDSAAVKAAIDAAAAVDGTVYFGGDGKYVINDNITVPENVSFAVATTATVSIADGKTLKINSKNIYIAKKTVFNGSGNVDFTDGVNYAFPEWFVGSNAQQIQKAINAADCVYFARQSYTIEEQITIPQSRDIELHGMSSFSSVLAISYYDATKPAIFNYSYESGKASTFTVTNVKINDDCGDFTTLVKFSGNPETNEGKVTFNCLIIARLGWLADIEHTTGSSFTELYGLGTGYFAKMGAGVNDTEFKRSLASGPYGGILVADGLNADGSRSSGIYFERVSSVGGSDIDFYIANYTDVEFMHSSADLSKGMSNEAGLKMVNVDNFKVVRCWWASNAGLSYDKGAAYAKIRRAILLDNCSDGQIYGCSIVNQQYGVYIVNSAADAKDILIEGNTFQANGHSDVYLENAKNVKIHGNFMMSASQYGNLNQTYRNPGGNYNIFTAGSNSNVSVAYNTYSKTFFSTDAILSSAKVKGVTVGQNFYGSDIVK